MTRVRFTGDFDYRPTSIVITAYKTGMELTVKRECAEQAIAAGKAIEVSKKNRNAEISGAVAVEVTDEEPVGG